MPRKIDETDHEYKVKWTLANRLLNMLRAAKGEPLVENKYPEVEVCLRGLK